MTRKRREKRRPPSPASAVELAIEGKTTGEIASVLGVHRATVWSWLADPGRSAQVEQARRLAAGAVAVRLGELAHDALDTLSSIMVDPVAPHLVRVRAAVEILDRAGIRGEQSLAVDVRYQSGVNLAPLLARLCEHAGSPYGDDGDPNPARPCV